MEEAAVHEEEAVAVLEREQMKTQTAATAVEPGPDRSSAVALAALAGTALSACGGGGGDSAGGTVVPDGVPVAPPSDGEAARFLAQAGLAASTAEIATLKTQGYAGWLDTQFNTSRSQSHYDWMVAKGYAVEGNRGNFNGLDNSIWRKLISSPDPLRQRVVLALSEIFVVSMAGLPVNWRGFVGAAYLDMLEERCFGSFRALLEGVTLSAAMGTYLNMRGNRKEEPKTGRVPDENYAREVMQLFTIGLVEINADGTPRLGTDGKPIDTYTQAQISELARVFTGWEFDNELQDDPGHARRPMVHIASRFSTGAKKVLNVDIPATADGPTALGIALDTLANHANVGPFIGRQLIQRLVCSNPSSAYLQRVAAAFANNGSGQRGDMKAVIRAVLLDPEARSVQSGSSGGKLREPVLRFVQWARTVGLTSPTELWNVGNLSDPATRLGQSPLRAPSVFNFFRPGYVPPNSALGTAGVTAPEFQLCNETTVAGYLNFMQNVVANGIGELKPDHAAQLTLANDAAALLAHYELLLAANQLSETTRTTIVNAVNSIAASSDARRLNRIQATILLIMASPDYLVQK
jgi:uncharacterized protein (DUF1800 family)